MGDERRRYLIQQMELGGSEVVLERGAAAPAAAPAPTPALTPESPAQATPKWKKGAPPIPGPGLTIEPPAPTLLAGDPLADLESLKAVAERIRASEW